MDRSFGFHTAVEAESAGHIALHATLSRRDVDGCLRCPGGL
jgi:hypothetical protein